MHLVDTRSSREYHSSAVKDDERILLIGGLFSTSTEWIWVDGSPSQPGPFDVRHGMDHCTIQLSSDLIVVTGGDGTEDLVTSERQRRRDGANFDESRQKAARLWCLPGCKRPTGEEALNSLMMIIIMFLRLDFKKIFSSNQIDKTHALVET